MLHHFGDCIHICISFVFVFEPVWMAATALGDGRCEGSSVLGRHQIVDYRINRRAKKSFTVFVE